MPISVSKHDARSDSFTGHISQDLIHKLGRKSPALADEAFVQPLASDPLQLPKEMEFRLLSRITPTCAQQAFWSNDRSTSNGAASRIE